MVLITSTLVGVSVACGTWLFLYKYQQRRLVAHRLTAAGSSVQLPYTLQSLLHPHKGGLTANKLAEKNQIHQDLFLGGLRTEASARFFTFLTRLSLLIPLVLVVIYALTNQLTLRNTLTAALLGLGLFFYIRLTIRIFKRRRQQRILRALPQFLDLIVICVEAGLSFNASLERILREVDSKEPLTVEFRTMYHEFLNGLPLAQACQRMDQRCGVQDLSMLLSTIVQSDQMGAGLGSSLRVQAAELRDKLKQRIRSRAHQIPVKILFPVVLIFGAFTLLNLSYVGFQMKTVIRETRAQGAQAQNQN